MDIYNNKEENFDSRKNDLLQHLHPMNFAMLCGCVRRSKLEEVAWDLISDIKAIEVGDNMFHDAFEHYKLYFIDFVRRATKAILTNDDKDILPMEEKAVLFARDAIIPDDVIPM